jgi:hypothetical protein
MKVYWGVVTENSDPNIYMMEPPRIEIDHITNRLPESEKRTRLLSLPKTLDANM